MKNPQLFLAGLIYILTPNLLNAQSVHLLTDTVNVFLFSSPTDSVFTRTVVNIDLDSAGFHMVGYEKRDPTSGNLNYGSRKFDKHNDNGEVLYTIYERFETDTRTWELDSKTDFFKDEYGYDTLTYYYKFSDTDDNWNFTLESRYEYKYDEYGQIIESIYFSGDSGEVEMKYRSLNSYSDEGKHSEFLQSEWNGTEWKNTKKLVYTFDDKGRRTSLTQNYWDTGTQDWWVRSFSSTSYSSDGTFSCKENSSRSDKADSFEISKTDSYFDQNGNLLKEELFYWDEDTGLFTKRLSEISLSGIEQVILYATICEGDSIQWQGNFYSEETNLWETFKNAMGRDSIQRLELNVSFPPPAFEINGEKDVVQHLQTLYWAPPDSQLNYSWELENGVKVSGDMNDSVWVEWQEVGEGRILAYSENSYGCRSDTAILEVSVSELLEYSFYEYDTICDEESLQWQGKEYMQEGTYVKEYFTGMGGDSTYTLNLVINQKPSSFAIVGMAEVCKDQCSVYSVPENPEVDYFWNVYNSALHSGTHNDTVEVTWEEEGNGWLSVFAVNEAGCMSDTVLFEVLVGPNGIRNATRSKIQVFPNPFDETLYISCEDEISAIKVFDLQGRNKLSCSPAQGIINLSTLDCGIYLIQFIDNNGHLVGSKRIIKK